MRRMLLSYVCRPSVGHVVEAMRYTQGFHEANPGTEIHLAMSNRSALELAARCPWIRRSYAIDLDYFDNSDVDVAALAELPKEWDYIVDDNTIFDETDGVDPALHAPDAVVLVRFYELTATALVATLGRGTLSPSMRLPDGLTYRPNTRVTLAVPPEHRLFARRYSHDGPKIGVLLGSSSGQHKHPGVASWIRILLAVAHAFPTARFYLTGTRASVGGRTRTAAYSDEAIDQVLSTVPEIVDCFDIGIWNQVAMIEGCDAFIAPNAGFSLLAPCVGTPLLTIAGGDETEWFFNDVPFYVVLPDTPDYPYAAEPYVDSKIPCMRPENLEKKVPEIVEGIGLLLDSSFDYLDAVERYVDNIAHASVRRPFIPVPGHPQVADF